MNAPTGKPNEAAQRPARKESVAELKRELQARSAEADWLKTHYEEQLRLAWAEVETLLSRPPELPATAAKAMLDPVALTALHEELERLREAEARYLDRIEELKEMLAAGPDRP